MNPIDELTDYCRFIKIIETKNDKIKLLDAESKAIKSGLGDVVSVKGGTDGNKLDAIIDEKQKLNDEIELYRERCRFVESVIGRMDYPFDYVLRVFYMSGLTSSDAVTKIQDELLYCQRYVYRLRELSVQEYMLLCD